MNDEELRAWEEAHRHPHLRRSPAPWAHRWNPGKEAGNKVGGVVIEDRIEPRSSKRMIVLDVPRRTRNVTVWVSYRNLITLIDEAAPRFGERLGVTYLGDDPFRVPLYEISLPDRTLAPDPVGQGEDGGAAEVEAEDVPPRDGR